MSWVLGAQTAVSFAKEPGSDTGCSALAPLVLSRTRRTHQGPIVDREGAVGAESFVLPGRSLWAVSHLSSLSFSDPLF